MFNVGKLHDCVVVGGGPAGLSCALLLARHQRSVVVFDDGRPRNAAARAINGLIGRHATAPAELIQIARQEASEAGVRFLSATVEGIDQKETHFLVSTAHRVVSARRIVLAYGVRDEIPTVEGAGELYGKGVFHCPTCDGYEIRGRDVAALGKGTKVAGLALELLQWAKRVTILTNGEDADIDSEDGAKLAANDIEVVTDPVVCLGVEGAALGFIDLRGGRRLKAGALFFTLGTKRSSSLAEELGCEIDREKDVLIVDEDCLTTVPGVYAIGDIVDGPQLVAKAASDGAIAAVALHKSLLPPSRMVR